MGDRSSTTDAIAKPQILWSISCATQSFCVVSTSSGGVLIYDHRKWSSIKRTDPGGDGIVSVSCPSSSFCAAVDLLGDVLTMHGVRWSRPRNVDAYGGVPGFSAVSCTTSTFCLAVDSTNGAFFYNGTKWSKRVAIGPTTTMSFDVSCPTQRICVVAGRPTHAYNSGDWSRPMRVATYGLDTLSCATTTFCVADDDRGNLYIGT